MPFVNNQGVNIHYESVGEAKNPTILMNHGNGNSLEDWKSLGYIDLLKKYRLILVDARGFGKSDKPTDLALYTSELITQDFIMVLDALNIKKCHYFGNSRGGSMGFLFAHHYPQYFKSFYLCSAQPFGSSGPHFSEEFIEWLGDGNATFIDNVEKKLGQKFPPQLRATFLANDPEALIAANTPLWPNYAKTLQLDTQMLLVVGDKDNELLESNKQFVDETRKLSFMFNGII